MLVLYMRLGAIRHGASVSHRNSEYKIVAGWRVCYWLVFSQKHVPIISQCLFAYLRGAFDMGQAKAEAHGLQQTLLVPKETGSRQQVTGSDTHSIGTRYHGISESYLLYFIFVLCCRIHNGAFGLVIYLFFLPLDFGFFNF